MSLVETTRPQSIQEMVLTEESRNELDAIRTMIKSSQGGVGAILLVGPTGCGKTTAARILARQILLPEKSQPTKEDDHEIRFNLHEANAGDETGIDAAREIATFLSEPNLFMKKKAVIIDEAQGMTKQAQNCILKPMEDNPHATVIICTTDPSKLLPTIKTRCITVNIQPIDQDSESDVQMVADYLNKVASSDGYFPSKDIFRAIAKSQPNSMRSFVHKVDLLNASGMIDLNDKSQKLITGYSEEAEAVIIEIVREVVKVIRDKDKMDVAHKFDRWKNIAKALGSTKENPETIRIVMCSYISKALTNMNIKTRSINAYNAFLALGNLLVKCTDKKEVNKDELYAIIFDALFDNEFKR